MGDEYSNIPEREYRVVAPLFCFRSVMWHHPNRVLRQFGMEQPIPRTEMTESEVTRLLGLTWRREIGMRETMQQYLARRDARDDHVAETGPVRHPVRCHRPHLPCSIHRDKTAPLYFVTLNAHHILLYQNLQHQNWEGHQFLRPRRSTTPGCCTHHAP
ncbi:Serine/threonine-protein phosphatase 7 long form homolog [Linum grandiflorum]